MIITFHFRQRQYLSGGVKDNVMTLASELAEQLTAQTGLSFVDASHLAGRCNGYFTKAEIQSHLSRVSLSIFAFGIDRDFLLRMEDYLNHQDHPSSHAIVLDDSQLTIFLPIIHNAVPDFHNLLLRVTTYLKDSGIPADLIEKTPEVGTDWTHDSGTIRSDYNPRYLLGFFGSFLGAIPGAMLWFIFSMISSYEYLARFPENFARLSPWFIFSVIITCGSYWGFLLLSDATRKTALLMSFPITLATVFFSNHTTFAFIIYSALPGSHYFEVILSIQSPLESFGLTTYYWVSFILGIVLAAISYFFVLRFREKGWIKS